MQFMVKIKVQGDDIMKLKERKPKVSYIIAIITLLISTMTLALFLTISYDSIALKFGKPSADQLALILLIPLVIAVGLVILISSGVGLTFSIRTLRERYLTVSSIIFVVLHSLYLLSYIVIMVLLFI